MSHARKEYKDFMSLTPDAYAAVLALGQVAGKAGMDKQLLELIKLRASQINGCAFCVQYHILESEKLGVPADKLNLVVVWREAPQFSPRERAALAWTEALTLLAMASATRSMRRRARSFRNRSSPISRPRSPRSMSGTGSAPRFAGHRRHGSKPLARQLRKNQHDDGAARSPAWRLPKIRSCYATVGRSRPTSSCRSAIALRSPERCRSRHRWNSPSNSA